MGRFDISDELMAWLREIEGYKNKAYQDSKGVWTIGYGHTKGVIRGMICDRAQAENWLAEELREAGDQVDILVTCQTQGQWDALTDFVYNLGYSRLKSSTLLRYIRLGKPLKDIQDQFRRWVYCTVDDIDPKTGKKITKKIKLDGLVRRREWEAKRWAE